MGRRYGDSSACIVRAAELYGRVMLPAAGIAVVGIILALVSLAAKDLRELERQSGRFRARHPSSIASGTNPRGKDSDLKSDLVLFRGSSAEGKEAEALLRRAGIDHVVVAGNPDDEPPFVEDQGYYVVYIGIERIRRLVRAGAS
jgi:hypothetical protein